MLMSCRNQLLHLEIRYDFGILEKQINSWMNKFLIVVLILSSEALQKGGVKRSVAGIRASPRGQLNSRQMLFKILQSYKMRDWVFSSLYFYNCIICMYTLRKLIFLLILSFCNVYFGNWHAYYEEYNFFNILHRCISEMVILRKKSIRTIFIGNFMMNNFCLIYFYYKTYRLAEKLKKPIFATFDLE